MSFINPLKKVLPQLVFKYHTKGADGAGPRHPKLACHTCKKSNIVVGSGSHVKNGFGTRPVVFCEDCAIGQYQKKWLFESRDIAAAHRRRSFDVMYLFQELVLDRYMAEQHKQSIDDLNDEEILRVSSLANATLVERVNRSYVHEIEEMWSQDEVVRALAPIVAEVSFEPQPSIKKCAIEFTVEQYRKLLDVLFMAQWVKTAHEIGNVRSPFDELEHLIYGHAQDFGLGRYCNRGAAHPEPSGDYEEDSSVPTEMLDFEDEVFWSDLTEKLSLRDMGEQFPDADNMEPIAHEKTYTSFEKKYAKEFKKYGIARLRIDGDKKKE